jgi:hypothetical protein
LIVQTKNKTIKIKYLIFLLFTTLAFNAQEIEELKEFFTLYPNKKKVEADSTRYLQKFILAPVISYSPETSLSFGTGAKYLFKFNGSGEETRVSNMPITIQYTLNNQFFLYSGFEMFTNQEKWVIEGNLLFQNYPRLFYGFGNDTPQSAEEQYDYYQFLFEPIFLKQLFAKYLFFGGGIRINHIFNTAFEDDGLIDLNRPTGFDGSTTVGIEVASLYDSRNNLLNANSGWYFETTFGGYDNIFGSTHDFQLFRYDLRHYFPLNNKTKDVLAFQTIGQFTRGDIPFSEFSFFGSSEIMRGYREGRYVDRDMVALQVEYRKSFSNTRFGAVAFAGVGNVYRNISDFQFNNNKPNYGIGLRYKIDKSENLNIRLDWGFGENKNNIYLSIAEAF